MREVQDILRHFADARAAGRACALATVVRVAGSTYRRPGARMLITAEGSVTGCVSGGCLEREVFDQARYVLATGVPKVLRFDSQSGDDVVFGFGLGCNGVVEILVERLNDDSHQMRLLAECVDRREDAVLAAVFAIQGRLAVNIADRLTLRKNGRVTSDIADRALLAAVAQDAGHVLDGASKTIHYALSDGSADVFVEHVAPPLPLIVFGAGHDAVPLVQLAGALGWHVTLVDYRPDNIARARALNVDVIVARPEEFAESVTFNRHARFPATPEPRASARAILPAMTRQCMAHGALDPRGAVVVMNHNYLDDRTVLETVLHSPVRYVGVLGPRVRTERMLADLRKRNHSWTGQETGRLFAPAGLDIGADNPEEIALSIVAEIKAVFSGRSGEPLREKSGPLHGRMEETHTPLAAGRCEEGCRIP